METGVELGLIDQFPVGTTRLVQKGPKPVLIVNHDGKFTAFEDYCPHRAGPLSEGKIEGNTITCPWHGACFDVLTGDPVKGTRAHLKMHRTEVRGDRLFLF